MKLRIRDNSIRLRLTQGEVAALAGNGSVRAAVNFANGAALVYSCEASSDTAAPGATLDGQTLAVHLPLAAVRAWAGSDEVSLQGEQELADGNMLSLLVEKDFACLAPRPGEDEADMFANPLEGSERC